MKKVIITALFAFTLAGFVSAADILSGSTTVVATIESVLQVKDVTASTAISLNVAGETKSIGTATFYTNRKNWNVTVTSAHGGKLQATDNGTTYSIPYTFTLSNAALGTLVNDKSLASAQTAVLAQRTTPANGLSGDVAAMSIKYGAEDTANWFAGLSYTDTITIQVAAL